MTFAVIVTDQAAQEVEEAAQWWAQERSVEHAVRWHEGIQAAIAGIKENPWRFPLIADHDQYPYELRELHFGLGPRASHRVLFHDREAERCRGIHPSRGAAAGAPWRPSKALVLP